MPKTRNLLLGALGVAAVGVWLATRPEHISFADKVVIITGGSRGLGLVLARQLGREGARLALLARSQSDLDEARRQVEQLGGAVLPIVCDIRNPQDVADAVERVLDHYGRIDVLINNAGVIQVGPVEHMELADFEDSLAVHFWGPLYAIHSILPHMRAQGEGRIVNITSIGGKVAVPHLLPYSVGKHALVGLSEGLRHELAKHDILVTTVCPGLMRTGSPRNAYMKGQREKEYAWFAVSDSLPLLTIDAERAARKILDACRQGKPRLTITPQARVLAIMNEVAPTLLARASGLIDRLLPAPIGDEGDASEPGHRYETSITRSVLTVLGRKAAARNNETDRVTVGQAS